MDITDNWLAFDFDNTITEFAITVQNRLDEQVESVVGRKTVYKPKYTLAEALRVGGGGRVVTTFEQAVAMGFIPMDKAG